MREVWLALDVQESPTLCREHPSQRCQGKEVYVVRDKVFPSPSAEPSLASKQERNLDDHYRPRCRDSLDTVSNPPRVPYVLHHVVERHDLKLRGRLREKRFDTFAMPSASRK